MQPSVKGSMIFKRITILQDKFHYEGSWKIFKLMVRFLLYHLKRSIFKRQTILRPIHDYKMYLNMDYMKAMTGGEPIIDTTDNTISGYEWGDKTEWLLNNLTAGVGFRLKTGNMAFRIDYAYMNKGILKATHRLGLTLGF